VISLGYVFRIDTYHITCRDFEQALRYVSIIGTGVYSTVFNIFLELANGDGIVTTISENLRRVIGTNNLNHESKEIFIADRLDCGHDIRVDRGFFGGIDVFTETHTCETGDLAVWAELLHQLY
jgi:hypothetical protein